MVNLKRIPCFAWANNHGNYFLVRGYYDSEALVGVLRLGFGKKATFIIPESVHAGVYRKRPLFNVDMASSMAVPFGKPLYIDETFIMKEADGQAYVHVTSQEIVRLVQKNELLAEGSFLRHLGGSADSVVMLLIKLGAGYGFFRFLEYLFTGMGR